MRQQGLQTNGGPFTIQSRTKADEHFVLTYTATGTDKNIGLDLTSLAGRQEVYSQALVSKDVYGSGTVTVGAGTPTAYQGFFLTIPVYSATSTKPIGVVNAILNYKLFFSSLFSGSELSPKVGVSLTDQSTGQVIYNANNNSGSGQDAQTDKVSLPVANQRWWLTSRADRTFGVGDVQMRVPALTLVVGQLFSVFLLMLFFILWRGRQRALDLAETITGDLQAERNKAVGNAQRSKAILASIGDGVFAVDMNRRLTLLNPAASEISGVSEEDALGKPYDEVLRFELEKDGSVNDSFIRQAFEGHLATMKNHTILVRADGRRVAVADSAAPIRGAHDKIIGVIVVFRDVSKEYQLDKAKTEFVSLASHQLRTPLSAINWYGEMLLNGDAGKLNKIQHEYVNEIFEGSQRMVELVNGLLDVSRLEVGKLANLPSPTNIAVLIDSLEKELEITVQSKKLHFIKEVSAIPDVIADPKQLRMILQNLMSNAVKYTPDEGSVTITLGPSNTKIARAGGLPDRFAHGHWFLSVSDTGYGIPKDQQAKIFTKMFRADNVRKLDVEGTGLGLYIVREVAEGMGGRVWFESTESIGTTFTVVLPFMTGHHK
jgi:PAS domain S-box-containing protein